MGLVERYIFVRIQSSAALVFVLIAEKAHDDGHAAHSLSVMTLALLLGKQAQPGSGAFSLTGVVVVVPANVTGVLTYRPDGAGGSAYSGLLGPPAQGGPASHVRLTPEG